MSEKNQEPILNAFHPQAYLMFLNSFARASLKSSNINNTNEVTGVHKLSGDYRPESVMSKVYNAKSSSGDKLIKAHFFNLETPKITSLIPELRFFKVQDDIYTPFFFPISTISDEAASATGYSRTKGSGVKSFNVNFMGTNPFEAPKFLKASLELFVDNLANIFDEQKGYAPLADLFTISIAKNSAKKGKLGSTVTSGDFVRPIEVAATLGYVIPELGDFTQEEIKEIKSSNLAIRMNVIRHEINVNQDGSALIRVEYTARINNSGRDKIFSATDNPVDLLKRANIRQLFAPEKKNVDSTEKKKDKLKAEESARRSQVQKATEARKILEILEREKKIYSIKTSRDLQFQYTTLGVKNPGQKVTEELEDRDLDRLVDEVTKPQEDVVRNKDKQKTLVDKIEELDNSDRRVYYITFGDLISAFFKKTRASLLDAAELLNKAGSIPSNYEDFSEEKRNALQKELKVSKHEFGDLVSLAKKTSDEKNKIRKTILGAVEKLKTYRVLLPAVEFKRYVEGNTEPEISRINIADVPISLEIYQEFMFDKIMNSYRNTYTIPQFLNDCVSHLLPNAFGSSWTVTGIAPRVVASPPKFTSTVYTGPQLRNSMVSKKSVKPEDIPSPQKDFRATNIQDECDYFVIYQQVDRELSSDRAGTEDKDSKDGIYHFQIGKNRGLIKEIQFSRFDVPFAQEQLMTNQVGLYDELKMPYTANITMFGNNLFVPGSQIFINPNNIGFGSATDFNSPAFRIGLGGYYTVIGVETNITDGIMTTSLNCSFGSHASESEGLTDAAEPNPSIEDINKNNTSNDSVANIEPDISGIVIDVSQSHYLPQLEQLANPDTGEKVMDMPLARAISNDYILNQDNNTVTIPGVIDKSINPQTGAVRYNLIRGQIVEIDDSRPSNKSVKLVNSTDTLIERSQERARTNSRGNYSDG